MHKLAEICVRRPVFATVLVLVLIVFGFFGYTRMGVDWFPKVDFPVVLVTTVWPGTAPEEMETEVSDKIEEAVNTVSGIEELRSISTEGVSRVVVMFRLEKDINVAAQEVRDKINQVLPQLADGVKQPTVNTVDPDASPVLSIAVSSDAPVKDLTEYSDKVLRRQLESVAGVGQVLLVGGQLRQVNVQLDTTKLRAHNLTVVDVARALQSQNIQVPGGSVKIGAAESTVRTLGRVASVDEIKYLPVTNRMGHIITIGDVATVEDGVREPESLAQLNDTPAVLLDIRKQSGTNTIEVVRNVKERLEALKESSARLGYHIEVVRDQSIFIQASVDMVQEHLILGSLFAAIVVLLFLANARTTLISALAIPTSIIGTFAIMHYMGFTLNVLTLLALTLSVGIVIDDAIVVLENIFRFIEEKKLPPMEAARAATKEIGLAVVSITLSLTAVFIPIAFMEGIIGRFMWSFGITMASAILISMLVSFSLTPMLASRWLKAPFANEPVEAVEETHSASKKRASKQRGFYHRIEQGYVALLKFSLRHRWLIVAIMIALLATIPYEFKLLPKNFVPNDDRSEFQIEVRTPEGTSLEATQLLLARIARDVRQLEGTKYTVTSIADTAQRIANLGTIYVRLADASERQFAQDEVMDYIRKNLLPKYESEHLRVSLAEVAQIAAGSTAMIQYAISGPDMKKLEEYAGKVMERLHNYPGAVDIDSNLVVGKPQYGVVVDRAKAADLGVSIADIANTLRLLVAGDKVTDYNEKGEQYEVRVRAAAQFRNNIEELKMVSIPSFSRGTVPLGDVAQFDPGAGPAQINRLNRAREVTIYTNLTAGASMQDVIDTMNQTMADLHAGSEYKTSLAGESKEMARAFKAYVVVFATAFIFIYLVLAAQFESWLHPITILVSLPLTLPFALISLILFKQSINILSLLGVLVLFAVVKKNAILQIDHTNQLRAEGMSRWDAIIAANIDRLRPILMTTVAFVAGMIPLLVSNGTGAATNRTMSCVIVGGQTLSLLLTLLATPVVYSLFDDLSNLFRRKKAKETRDAIES